MPLRVQAKFALEMQGISDMKGMDGMVFCTLQLS